MAIRGIRGATTIEKDTREEVLSAVRELLGEILKSNPTIITGDIASAVFTTTEDIVAEFPAFAARQLGWDHVPMICAREIPVPDGLPHCIRVLIHWNTDVEQDAVNHVYLREAKKLRPDLGELSKSKMGEGESV